MLGLKSDFSYLDRVLDIQCIQKGIYLGLKSIPENRTAWQYQMYHYVKRGVKTSVKHLCGLYDIEYNDLKAHDAVYDNEKCLEIFKKQILTIEI
jgi:DNA polymerase III epsilon subunit-like protein